MTLTQGETRTLKKYAFDTTTGFIGTEPLYRKLQQLKLPISRAKIREFMKTNEVNQVFQPPKRASKKQPKIVAPPGSYQADLTFFKKYKSQNNGFYILLTLININNKRGLAYPLKNKSQKNVLIGLQQLISVMELDDVPVQLVQTDNGTEFKNKLVSTWLEKRNIKQEFVQAGDKPALGVAERFNLTLKQRIEKYIVYNQSVKWIDKLPDILENYNTTYHTSIKMAPLEMELADEVDYIHDKVVENQKYKESSIPFKIGDKVRLANERGAFHKIGQNWSSIVYTVSDVFLNNIRVDGRTKKYKPNQALLVNADAEDVDNDFRKKQRRLTTPPKEVDPMEHH